MAKLANTRTHENLKHAFAAESQANRRYMYFARRADIEGLPCYLETGKAIDVRFYRKHGFEVLTVGDLPLGGPRFWTMLREPVR